MSAFATCLPRGKAGMALFGILMILASLSIIAGTVFTVVRSNVAATGHHKLQQESFFQADAAIHYVQTMLGQDLRSGAVDLDQDIIALNYSAPAGYNFDTVTNLIRLANTDHYLLEVTGRSQGASTRIEAILGRRNALGKMGLFGDEDLQIQPGFDIYSYNSDVVINPTPADSTGDAGIGSNITVGFQPGVGLDGSVFLGMSAGGVQATGSGLDGLPVFLISRVEPDPLGAIGGPLATSFSHYSNAANNDNAAAGIVNNVLSLGNKSTFTIDSGVYYLDEFELGNNSQLYVNSTPDDPAVIFLSGEFRCSTSSEFMSATGSPQGLYIFSNDTSEFRLQPKSEFRGFVYVPYADMKILPSDNAYGVFWAKEIKLQPSGDLYIDTALLDQFVSGMLETVQWKEIRD